MTGVALLDWPQTTGKPAMAYDEELARQMRDDLGPLPGLSEIAMFGGICFMLHGNMTCGVHKNGLMYRVGKPAHDDALALPGTRPMDFTGRPMRAFVDLPTDAAGDDTTRERLTRMAVAFAGALPAK